MTIIEKIQKAWGMNYAAIVQSNYREKLFTVVAINNDKILFDSGSHVANWNLERFKILDYIYIGQLGGNESISKRQKFKMKENCIFKNLIGKILTFSGHHLDFIMFKELEGGFCKSEVEPIFD